MLNIETSGKAKIIIFEVFENDTPNVWKYAILRGVKKS